MGSRSSKSKFLNKLGGQSAKLSTNIKGTIAEYQEIVNLSRRGLWVAKACDPQCPFDLVTVTPDGSIELLDIKTNTYRKKNYTCKKGYTRNTLGNAIVRTPTKKQKKLGIKILMVDHSND
tara:strand:+ start:6503 stop:6862 length:360 start_codon:yes stop_codon:yes gene_type:complete